MKRALRFFFARAESALTLAFGSRNNPMMCLGALGWFFFWIAGATGVYLYIIFDTGIVDAYASVEYMTNEQWYAGGIMRSLHRYASDALVVVTVMHLLREFSLDRLRGKRFFAWVTGVILLALIYVCGISGYWLVWDKLAQYIAVATSEWLDVLPFFGEPIANNFLNSNTLGGRFFTLMVFIHIFAPLFMLFMMWVHIQRHSAAQVNPPMPIMIGTGVTMLALSLLHPAVSQGPADLDVVPATVNLDWFYLPAYPLLDVIPGGQLWLYMIGGGLILLLLPWVPPERTEAPAVVSLENCNGCARCFDDCPYSAITMVPRSDGRSFETEAVVDPDNCLSCGICAGSCPTSTPFRRAKPIEPGIQLPYFTISALRDQVIEAGEEMTGDDRVLVFSCRQSRAEFLQDEATRIIPMPCVGMLPPSFIDYALSRNHTDGVMIAACGDGDCFFRLGGDWTQQRIAGERDPYLRRRVPREKLCMSNLPAHARRKRKSELARFKKSLGGDGA